MWYGKKHWYSRLDSSRVSCYTSSPRLGGGGLSFRGFPGCHLVSRRACYGLTEGYASFLKLCNTDLPSTGAVWRQSFNTHFTAFAPGRLGLTVSLAAVGRPFCRLMITLTNNGPRLPCLGSCHPVLGFSTSRHAPRTKILLEGLNSPSRKASSS